MQTDYERYIKMSSLAQIGWWEADFAAGHYLCSDFLCELLGLEGDTISFQDFQKLIREDYREQIIQEFRANANIHRNFYEQTFPIRSRYGEIWLHTRLAHREKGTGTNGGDKSFGVIQRVEAPKESEQRDALRRVNSLLRRQSFISQSLLRFLHDEEVDSCVMEILNDILNLYYGEGRVYIFEYDENHTHQSCIYEVVSEGVSSEKDSQQNLPINQAKWWSKQILSGTPILLNSLNQLPEEAEDEYRFLDAQGILSIMVTPLRAGDHIWGYMGIDLVKTYHEWSNEDYQWFSSLANIISICIELRKAKDKVIREQVFLNNLFRFMPMGYLRLSIIRDEQNRPCDYKVTDGNSLVVKFFGSSIKEYMGCPASKIHPDYVSKLELLVGVMQGNTYKEGDDYVAKTGIYTHWIVYSPEEDEVVALFLDTTQAVKANRAMDRSEKLFQNIFANIPAGVEIYDKDGYLVDMNNMNLEIFGVVNKSEVIGVNFFENPNVPQQIRDRVRNEDLVDFRLNYSFRRAEGYYLTNRSDIIELYTKVTKLYDNEGNFSGYILINIDNTERIDAINRIRDFENFFLLISDYAKVGYAKLNLMSRKGYAIKQWYKNVGEEEDTPLSEVVGIYRHVHPDDRRYILDFYEEVKKGNRRHFQKEMRVRRVGTIDQWNWVRSNIMVTNYRPEENEIEIIGINYDITELKETEAELILARDRAEMAGRLKSAFLANMSHEIRTPLNAIVGFSHLMTIADNAEDEKLYSDIINQNSEILLQLINDILDLAKIEAGTLEYIRYPMDLGELCRNVYEMHKDRVQTGVVLILDNKDTSLIINEDQNRIMQVVTNLITNAIKFTFKGEIRFGFEVREEYIDFYVKDTGMGISEEKIKMIFERFVKLNTFVQGTGLGLAICRVIVEKLGGEITAESKLNEGSTFRFTIPYKAGKKIPESGKVTKCPESGSTGPRKVLQRRTVLVAEDVDSNFLLLKTLLGKRCNLLWAKNGEDAVNQFKEHQPDLILMDIKMPHMDGLEATRLIRSYSKEVPIVALTAFAFESDKDRAIEAGCDDFLTKPVSQNALEKVLDKYVK